MAFGAGLYRARSDDIKTTFAGAGISFDFAAGAAISEHLVLFGTFFSSMHPDTKYSTDSTVGNRTITLSTLGFGPGLAYYMMPLNLYFSGALAFVVQPSPQEYKHAMAPDLGYGAGAKLMVGKDWWVSANWSLGVAADFLLSIMHGEKDPKPNWMIVAGGVSFVAKYN